MLASERNLIRTSSGVCGWPFGTKEVTASMRWTRILPFLAIGLGLATLAVHTTDLRPPWLTSNDFTPDYVSAKAWMKGSEPYQTVPELIGRYLGLKTPYFDISPPDQINSHPPILVVLTAPFALLPFRAARTLWFSLEILMMAAAVAWFSFELGWSKLVSAAAGLGLLALPVAQLNLQIGQWNGFLIVLLVGAWVLLRRERDAAAGSLLGIATAMRFFPVFMVVPLLRARRYRAAVTLVSVSIVASLAGVAAVGMHSTRLFLRGAPADTAFWRAHPANSSLWGVIYRWMVKSEWRPRAPSWSAAALALGLLAIAACVLAASRTPSRTARDRFWEAVPWMLLATPLAWQSHELLVVPLAMICFDRARQEGGIPPFTMLVGLALVIGSTPRGIAVSIGGTMSNLRWFVLQLPTLGLLLVAASGWLFPRGTVKNEAPGAMSLQRSAAAPL